MKTYTLKDLTKEELIELFTRYLSEPDERAIRWIIHNRLYAQAQAQAEEINVLSAEWQAAKSGSVKRARLWAELNLLQTKNTALYDRAMKLIEQPKEENADV